MTPESAAAPPRPKLPLNHKLFAALPTVAAEVAVLLDLKSVSRTVGPGHEIVSEGRRCTVPYMVIEGVAIRYRILRDGQRQILNVVLPGDFAGVRSCFYASALYSIKTLTRSAISPISLPKLIGLFDTHPDLAANLFLLFACEATVYVEHLIAVGRRSARQRVAHLLLELLTRLQIIGMADERSYRLPLTQEVISDVLGLSIPYVNRVVRQLRYDRLVRIEGQRVIIENMEELSALADFEHGYLRPLSIAESLTAHE